MPPRSGTLATVILYLIAQMVGAGGLIKLMFGLSYETAIVIVGVAMIAYVLFGGMIATTWVQIVKAVLLLARRVPARDARARALRLQPGWRCSRPRRRSTAPACSHPGKLVSNPLDAISLGMALMFGTAGLPHILMRFYTVPDARAARTSVFYATGLIGFFYLLTFVLGFGAMVLVGPDAIKAVDKGGNMAAPLLAEVLGGTPFLGFIAAVAFATILAVVAGLTLSGAAALSHDLWVNVDAPRRGGSREAAPRRARGDGRARHHRDRARHHVQGPERRVHGVARVRDRRERRTSRHCCCRSSGAASRRRAQWRACCSGRIATLLLIYLSPTIQVDILKHTTAWFPLKNPALLTIPLSFIVGIVVSLLGARAPADDRAHHRRMHLGESSAD